MIAPAVIAAAIAFWTPYTADQQPPCHDGVTIHEVADMEMMPEPWTIAYTGAIGAGCEMWVADVVFDWYGPDEQCAVVAHEIGHGDPGLALGHSDDPRNVMYPTGAVPAGCRALVKRRIRVRVSRPRHLRPDAAPGQKHPEALRSSSATLSSGLHRCRSGRSRARRWPSSACCVHPGRGTVGARGLLALARRQSWTARHRASATPIPKPTPAERIADLEAEIRRLETRSSFRARRTDRMPDRGPDVMGPAEAAETLGISTQRLGQLRDAGRLPPYTKLHQGKVWDGPEIRALAKDRGRANPVHTKVLQSYRKTQNITAAARTAGCSRGTARRVLHDVGLI
jgi:hypothetical protein